MIPYCVPQFNRLLKKTHMLLPIGLSFCRRVRSIASLQRHPSQFSYHNLAPFAPLREIIFIRSPQALRCCGEYSLPS
jgi:hypothetical protein